MLFVFLLLFARTTQAYIHALRDYSPAGGCPSACSFRENSRLLLDPQTYAVDLLAQTSAFGLVKNERKELTMYLLRSALLSCVPGDVVETGVFTGGSTAVLLHGLANMDSCARRLWAFDSFMGLPDPTSADATGNMAVGKRGEFAVGQDTFEANLRAMQAHDHRLRVVPGWFNETIPRVMDQIEAIVFLRLDGDMYQSTMDVLLLLYDRVTEGGFVYVDDYGSFNGCKLAVDEFRASRGVWGPLHVYEKDAEAAWWRKVL
jgi:hypothetical protein